MSPRRRAGRRIIKALLPIALLLVLSVIGLAGWIIYGATHPPAHDYLITPDKFLMSNRGPKTTDEVWSNRDGTRARGWLLRGAEGAPAVIILHRYGTDRSYLLNLGVKLNEATNFTVLWPDLRGHGMNPPVAASSFGASEAEDVLAALDYLRRLEVAPGRPLVSNLYGVYGVELGAYAALVAATRNENVRSMVLDSVPASPDDLLQTAVRSSTGFTSEVIQSLARTGARAYFMGGYDNTTACAAAARLRDRRALLLAGTDAPQWRTSTAALARCFPDQSAIQAHTDLPLTGFNLASAPGEQGEAYDRRVIEFLDQTLRSAP